MPEGRKNDNIRPRSGTNFIDGRNYNLPTGETAFVINSGVILTVTDPATGLKMNWTVASAGTNRNVIPAIASAVFDAIGVWVTELPITPERVLRAPLDYRAAMAPYDPRAGVPLYSPRAFLKTRHGTIDAETSRQVRDRLRAPGRIDSPLSREGAFLANNVLFAAFAFIVLLGTVFPLVVEAINNDRLSVGAPYFNRMTMPIGRSGNWSPRACTTGGCSFTTQRTGAGPRSSTCTRKLRHTRAVRRHRDTHAPAERHHDRRNRCKLAKKSRR